MFSSTSEPLYAQRLVYVCCVISSLFPAKTDFPAAVPKLTRFKVDLEKGLALCR